MAFAMSSKMMTAGVLIVANVGVVTQDVEGLKLNLRMDHSELMRSVAQQQLAEQQANFRARQLRQQRIRQRRQEERAVAPQQSAGQTEVRVQLSKEEREAQEKTDRAILSNILKDIKEPYVDVRGLAVSNPVLHANVWEKEKALEWFNGKPQSTNPSTEEPMYNWGLIKLRFSEGRVEWNNGKVLEILDTIERVEEKINFTDDVRARVSRDISVIADAWRDESAKSKLFSWYNKDGVVAYFFTSVANAWENCFKVSAADEMPLLDASDAPRVEASAASAASDVQVSTVSAVAVPAVPAPPAPAAPAAVSREGMKPTAAAHTAAADDKARLYRDFRARRDGPEITSRNAWALFDF